jgi:hypothetical protein
MESAARVHQGAAAGVSAREFDRRFHTFASGTAKKRFVQAASRQAAQPQSEISSEFDDMALQHRRTVAIQFPMQRL